MAAGALLSGGAVNAVGTAVGTQVLGLSGAAATSAGPAFIGGGSLLPEASAWLVASF